MYATSVPTTEFSGRERELAALDTELRSATESGTGRLLAIRGRRQVGKSRLVEHFAERSGVAYGVVAGMKGAPVDVQVRRAAETLRSSTRPLPALEAVTALPPGNWYDLLSRLQLALNDDPAILVIDEFPWANESSPGLDGLLQSLWDLMFARRPVLVLLIGSDEAMMDRLFEHDRPLFGRLDGNFVIEPFNPAETAQALGGSRSPVEVFDTQLITGGFPELVAHREDSDLSRLSSRTLFRVPIRCSPTSPKSTLPASSWMAPTPASSSKRWEPTKSAWSTSRALPRISAVGPRQRRR